MGTSGYSVAHRGAKVRKSSEVSRETGKEIRKLVAHSQKKSKYT